jgi:hypothetical protein
LAGGPGGKPDRRLRMRLTRRRVTCATVCAYRRLASSRSGSTPSGRRSTSTSSWRPSASPRGRFWRLDQSDDEAPRRGWDRSEFDRRREIRALQTFSRCGRYVPPFVRAADVESVGGRRGPGARGGPCRPKRRPGDGGRRPNAVTGRAVDEVHADRDVTAAGAITAAQSPTVLAGTPGIAAARQAATPAAGEARQAATPAAEAGPPASPAAGEAGPPASPAVGAGHPARPAAGAVGHPPAR